jgi:hypothetical protein
MADEKERAKPYLDRFAQLKAERRTWDDRWRDVARYIMPWKGRFSESGDRPNRGDDKEDKRMESTVTLALRRLAAGMQSGMTSPVRPWSRLRLHDEDLEKHGRVKDWLQYVETRMRKVFASSNFYDVAHNSYTEVAAFGTTVVWEGAHPQKLLNFKLFGVGEYSLDADQYGYVDTVYRHVWLNARQMVMQFGKDKCPRAVQEAYEKAPYSWFEVLHVIEPRQQMTAVGMGYVSAYIDLGSSTVLSESGFRTFPCMVTRWDQTGSDVYGWCPGLDSLPDIKMLMAMGKSSLEAIQKTVNPPLVAPKDFTSRKICMWPGGISYENEEVGKNEGLRPLYQVDFDVTAVETKMQQMRDALLSGFFNDLFLMIAQHPGMTATEVLERHEEKILMLGPVVEKQQSEFLDPLMNRTFDLMWQAGRDPLGRIDPATGWPLIIDEAMLQIPNPPEEMRGQDITPEYIGLLAQAQKQVGVGSIDRTMQFVAPMVQVFGPEVLDNLDGDAVIRLYAEMVGTPANLLRGLDDVEAKRQARAEAQARMQQEQAAAQQIGQAKALSEIDMQGPNGLTALAGAAPQGGQQNG